MGNIACRVLDLVVEIAISVIAERIGSLHADIRDELLLLADVRGGELVLVLRVDHVVILVVPGLVNADGVVTAVTLVFPLLCIVVRQARLSLGKRIIERFLDYGITRMRNDTLVTSIPSCSLPMLARSSLDLLEKLRRLNESLSRQTFHPPWHIPTTRAGP